MSNRLNEIERTAIPSPLVHDSIVKGVFRPMTKFYSSTKGHVIEEFRHGPRTSGSEHLRQIGSSAILSMNHLNIIDPMVVSTVAWRQAMLRVNMMAKSELWEAPVIGKPLGRILEAGGTFAIDRKKPISPDKSKHIADIFAANGVLGIFPEGTRQEPATELQREKLSSGVAVIALRYGVPILPVGIDGTHKRDRGPIAVAVNPPIMVDQLDYPAPDDSNLIQKDIMREVVRVAGGKRIKSLMDEVHAGMQSAKDIAVQLRSE